MGFYIIATTNGNVDTAKEEEQVSYEETSSGWIGTFRCERVSSVFLDMSDAAINILEKLKAKYPDVTFIPTEDGEMFGL